MRVGFVLSETVDGRFVPWESSLEWESYIDLYCKALMNRGHDCVKYVPSIEATVTESYRHKFGHVVKRVPVHHKFFNPTWLSRKRPGRTGLSTTAYPLQALGFTAHLISEAGIDRVQVLHYSSYYSSFFLPSFYARGVCPVLAQYSGGAMPSASLGRVLWRTLLAPSMAASSAILIGDYRKELESLRSQAGATRAKIRNFDSPVVDTSIFRPSPRAEAVRQTGFDPSRTNILSVTFIPKRQSQSLAKNPFALVSLFAEATRLSHSPLALHIVGFGPGIEDLRDHVRSEGVESQVNLLGRLPHAALPALYCASDLVFVPYTFERLNEGSVTFEAFACGTPVAGWRLSEDVPIEQEGGFLVDVAPASGARQLTSRLGDQEYISRKARESLGAGRAVSLDTAGAKLESYCTEAIKRPGGTVADP